MFLVPSRVPAPPPLLSAFTAAIAAEEGSPSDDHDGGGRGASTSLDTSMEVAAMAGVEEDAQDTLNHAPVNKKKSIRRKEA